MDRPGKGFRATTVRDALPVFKVPVQSGRLPRLASKCLERPLCEKDRH